MISHPLKNILHPSSIRGRRIFIITPYLSVEFINISLKIR